MNRDEGRELSPLLIRTFKNSEKKERPCYAPTAPPFRDYTHLGPALTMLTRASDMATCKMAI